MSTIDLWFFQWSPLAICPVDDCWHNEGCCTDRQMSPMMFYTLRDADYLVLHASLQTTDIFASGDLYQLWKRNSALWIVKLHCSFTCLEVIMSMWETISSPPWILSSCSQFSDKRRHIPHVSTISILLFDHNRISFPLCLLWISVVLLCCVHTESTPGPWITYHFPWLQSLLCCINVIHLWWVLTCLLPIFVCWCSKILRMISHTPIGPSIGWNACLYPALWNQVRNTYESICDWAVVCKNPSYCEHAHSQIILYKDLLTSQLQNFMPITICLQGFVKDLNINIFGDWDWCVIASSVFIISCLTAYQISWWC